MPGKKSQIQKEKNTKKPNKIFDVKGLEKKAKFRRKKMPKSQTEFLTPKASKKAKLATLDNGA